MTAEIDRRAAVALVAGAALAVSGSAMAQQPAAAARAKGYQPKPLPFDPKTIPGLSEKLLVSHHDNNYVGAVTRLGAIEAEVGKLDPATAPGFMFNGLKREELLAMNSMILHELYFASLGKGRSKAGAALAKQIETDFGSQQKWRDQFVAMGKALGGGSGWVLLSWSPRAGKLINQWAFDHTMTIADGDALVALDMYEHAYHMDFGAKAAAYVDAYMGALDWANADQVFAKAAAQPT
ncbi:MAG: Fe-Mn family superoxide dismutase [Hyphomonadaceae bacterium]|nr:Fe-Mn family superoxide dismutase [Hyphomonadaceae bacterium]